MDDPRPAWGKSSLVGKASLGLIVLGITCIALAWANIWAVGSPDSAARPSIPARDIVWTGTGATGSIRPSDTPTATIAYAEHPAKGDVVGVLSIPVLSQEFPILEGTGTKELTRGVGHMSDTAMPGEPDNCVLSGHRDTVFSRLGRLKVGDHLIVRSWAGTMTYEIKRIRVVGKNDRTVVVPADHAVLTVSTCYPFQYVGSAPRRYVLSADLVARQ